MERGVRRLLQQDTDVALVTFPIGGMSETRDELKAASDYFIRSEAENVPDSGTDVIIGTRHEIEMVNDIPRVLKHGAQRPLGAGDLLPEPLLRDGFPDDEAEVFKSVR